VRLEGALAAWAESGGMALTGEPDGPPLAPDAPVAAVMAAAGEVIGRLAPLVGGASGPTDAPALLGERGLPRNGAVSCGGATRLLPCADGWIAVGLPRSTDVDSIPAWLEIAPPRDVWAGVAARVSELPLDELIPPARLLELPVAAIGEIPPAPLPWNVARGGRGPAVKVDAPVVVDLSSLWAGPLCADLLQRAGAHVIKVEDPRRPDGARRGPRPFFDTLNGAKRSVAVDLSTSSGRSALRRRLDLAAVVVTSARPRAFEQLGIDPLEDLASSPTVWVAVTAYGWDGPGRNRVGFGDDAAVAAGLVTRVQGRSPGFVADAVADPLCGTLAAAAALACLAEGGSWFVDASLAGAAAYAMGLASASAQTIAASPHRTGGWVVEDGGRRVAVSPPRSRAPVTRAPALGAHTEEVLGDLLR
jgi:crotonobetainyl-CoA:carnitine CoA-transferase CaiB-like acyl-CoA transferase